MYLHVRMHILACSGKIRREHLLSEFYVSNTVQMLALVFFITILWGVLPCEEHKAQRSHKTSKCRVESWYSLCGSCPMVGRILRQPSRFLQCPQCIIPSSWVWAGLRNMIRLSFWWLHYAVEDSILAEVSEIFLLTLESAAMLWG